ncbi:MAG: hypothetical protein JST44_16145 [Cyanobacteria bacterium SZAS LIN-5]|nr:hypothetical protein [Cyanobacteria bacterium SZAS LIN-5]
MRKTLTAIALLSLLVLGGCATPLGQQYGAMGAAGGAIIGGLVTGDIRGVAAGAVIGGLGAGAVGDQQAFENQRRQQYGQSYPRRGYQDYGYQGGGYVRPCQQMRQPVYDPYGNYVGFQVVCR